VSDGVLNKSFPKDATNFALKRIARSHQWENIVQSHMRPTQSGQRTSQGLHGVAVFDPAWRGAGVFRLRSEEHFRVNLSCSYFQVLCCLRERPRALADSRGQEPLRRLQPRSGALILISRTRVASMLTKGGPSARNRER